MLKDFFRSPDESAAMAEAIEQREAELEARRKAAHLEWTETPWIIQQSVSGLWGIFTNNLNWMTGRTWIGSQPDASFPTKEKALEAVKRLANPQPIKIGRDGNPKEDQAK